MEKPSEELPSLDAQSPLTREKRPRSEAGCLVGGTPLISRSHVKEVPRVKSVCSYSEELSFTSFALDLPVYSAEPCFLSDPPTSSRSAPVHSLDARTACVHKAPVKTPVSAKSPATSSSGYFSSPSSRVSPLSAYASKTNGTNSRLASRRQKWATLLASTFMQLQEGYEEERVKDISTRIATAISGDGEEAKDTFLTLLMNLKDSKNELLRSRVIKGTLPVEVLVTLNEVDLVNPERRKKLDEEFEQRSRDTNLTEIEKALMTTSTLFSCPSCKARDCSWTQRQTRSGDEPMTVFCTCNVCGRTWRKN
ncbi:unnamed protein product [Phytomonas sp. EM1]|nr:unnamed protein product [Phytomonas sp. EM1]|eukprot:CCW62472.1 unnamed protein product [Phytomonas sp. isolate EM1]